MPEKIILVVGARPNFIKSAPLMKKLQEYPQRFNTLLIHTGQHYDLKLSKLFFDQLKMPEPDMNLGVGSGSHAVQTAEVMIRLEKVLLEQKPALVVVFGDVNSTLAASMVAAKLCIKLAHVEAGLRSFDHTMPEEINRVVTDRLSDYLFVTEKSGLVNLRNEGVPQNRIFFTGNIMIDSLKNNLDLAQKSDILKILSLNSKGYATLTLHRPSNVDDKSVFEKLLGTLANIGSRIPIVFPCHPRSRNKMSQFGLLDGPNNKGLIVIEPLGYLDFLKLQSESKFVLTDSGGVQEETTFLKIPCITLRENTERPVTVEIGSNVLAGTNEEKILDAVEQILDHRFKTGQVPELWDGKTSERIVDILLQEL